ncbi:hypothetical protein Gohar_003922 [Gossypium harknessii]|uniref:Uncharacterized protein n=1 Tax=Gossypium harknessii TaxID=34285 RepID=A0A7J9H3D3_9ROSI|nr:hypothetical protein [Gossypium harknessii]
MERFRLHHCKEFVGTKMGRKRVHKDEEEHWKTRGSLWYQ